MARAKFTLLGCDAFFKNAGDDLFKNLILPTGLDKETLTKHILMDGGEFEVLYANPFYIQESIGTWSAVNQDTFDRWVKALAIEYAPLENYDRQESWSDATGRNTSGQSSVTDASTTETQKSAYDSSVYQPNDKDILSGTSSTSVSNTDSATGNHIGRVHGNIGVTTSQQMLEAELELGYWNVYKRITDMFLKDFVILVYE